MRTQTIYRWIFTDKKDGGTLMNYPCLFCPCANLEHRLALPTRSRASVNALRFWKKWLV